MTTILALTPEQADSLRFGLSILLQAEPDDDNAADLACWEEVLESLEDLTPISR